MTKLVVCSLVLACVAPAQTRVAGIKAEVKPLVRVTPRAFFNSGCSPRNPCSASINVPYDTQGTPDTRANTWGYAAAQQIPFQFSNVPAGYRVRLLRLYGDHVAWVHGPVQPGTHSGVLWGIYSTAANLGSANVPYADDACLIYHQGAVSTGDLTQYFDNDVHVGGLLEADNTMILQMAVFENETGSSIHQEITFVLVYDYEPVGALSDPGN